MPSVADHLDRRPLWAEIALSSAFTAVLVAFGAACAFVGDAIARSTTGVWVFVILAYLLTVPFLVYYAYPPLRRRWYHYAVFEACVFGAFTLVVPLVYLPWLIVTRREWRRA
jgi:hypothetical protein